MLSPNSRPGPRPWRFTFSTWAEKVEEFSMPEPNSGCLLWLQSETGKGYCQTSFAGKRDKVHRHAWRETKGPIPRGLHVLHHCDVRCCVNEHHLFLGTNDENVADKMAKGRHRSARGEATASPLSEQEVREIRRDRRSCKVVGPEFGISDTACYNIRNRKTWKHVV